MKLPKTNNLSFEEHVKIHRKMGVTNCGDVNYEGTCCCTSGKNKTVKCPECGFELPEGNFCPQCKVKR